MSHDDRFLDLCAAYSVGAIDADDLRQLEEHLADGCDECERALRGFDEAVVHLASSAPPARPSPDLRARVLGSRRVPIPYAWIAAAAAVILAVWGWTLALIDREAPPPLREVELALTADATTGLKGSVIYDAGRRRLVLIVHNYRPPAGRDYELWAVRDGTPQSLGVVRTDDLGRAVVVLEDVAPAEAFAISREPEGGAPAGTPTTVVSLASLS